MQFSKHELNEKCSLPASVLAVQLGFLIQVFWGGQAEMGDQLVQFS